MALSDPPQVASSTVGLSLGVPCERLQEGLYPGLLFARDDLLPSLPRVVVKEAVPHVQPRDVQVVKWKADIVLAVRAPVIASALKSSRLVEERSKWRDVRVLSTHGRVVGCVRLVEGAVPVVSQVPSRGACGVHSRRIGAPGSGGEAGVRSFRRRGRGLI